MNNATQTREIDIEHAECAAEERTHRVTATAWLTGITAFLGFMTFEKDATIGAGLSFVAIAAMVATVCYFILKGK
jgi:hypothetical protein